MFPLEAFRNTLVKVVAIFERHAVRFHLTGGVSSTAYGEPRMTQDIDIVIDNDQVSAHVDSFLKSLRNSDFMFDEPTVRQAIDQRGMFQLFDTREALKLDVYPRELIPGELNRSQVFALFGDLELPIVSRADAAASKLVWISKGSHKSRRDVRQIFRMSTEADRTLIRELAAQLGLTALLDEVLAEPDEIQG